mmetsp:Transcript_16342/g.47308  ORF Transcript_16342/g.47308 Transcript_16342/m.47308 type:complete len:219 (-) Transcript_16342:494-1150(-)
MRHAFDLDRVAGQSDVHEAVLVVLAIAVRRLLRRDAAAATGHDVRRVPQEVAVLALGVGLLPVPVASEKQVDAVSPCQRDPELLAPLGREVRDDHLPLRNRATQALLQPRRLRGPQVRKPLRTIPYRPRALRRACGVRRVVRHGAQVVADEVPGLERVEDIGVQEEVVDGEVGIDHLRPPVLRRRHPSPGGRRSVRPRVADGLVPTGCEHETAIVVVT